MAQNIATTTTLAMFIQAVRTLTNTLDADQFKKIIDPILAELVHSSVVDTRTLAGATVDRYYRRNTGALTLSGASPLFTASLATYDIAQIESCKCFGTFGGQLKKIPIKGESEYLTIRNYYSSSDVGTTNAIARIFLALGTPDVLTLEIFTGATTITTPYFSYLKNPKKLAVAANINDTMDLPEHLVPMAEEMCAVSVFRILENKPPAELETRLTGRVNMLLQQYNVRLQIAQQPPQ